MIESQEIVGESRCLDPVLAAVEGILQANYDDCSKVIVRNVDRNLAEVYARSHANMTGDTVRIVNREGKAVLTVKWTVKPR